MAALTDPAGITISYGGVILNPNAYHNTKVSARPIMDEAKRATVAVEYDITVDATVVASTDATGNTDAQLSTMRRVLEQPALALKIVGLGFGDISVNGFPNNLGFGKVATDLAWGPWPQVLDWRPSGWNNAAAVTWRVVVKIPECVSPTYTKGIAALCWTVDWDIDVDGYTTVSTNGYLEIPLTRNIFTPRTLQDTADAYRDNGKVTWPPTRDGFQRQGGGNFKLSMDRRRLDFSFVDKQMPVAMPPGVTTGNVEHTIRSDQKNAFRLWHGSIGGTLVMGAHLTKAKVWDAIQLIIKSRMKELVQANRNGPLANGLVGLFKSTYIPLAFEFGESALGRESNFRYEYMIVGATIDLVLGASQMWQPIDGTSFAKWRASLDGVNKPNGIRGVAGLRHRLTDDVIIDLCVQSPPVKVGTSDLSTKNPKPGAPPEPGVGSSVKDPESTWLRYYMMVSIEEEPGRVVHKPLRDRPVQDPPPPQPTNSGSQNPVQYRVGGRLIDENGNFLPDPADGLDDPADDKGMPDAGEEPPNDGPEDIIQNVASPSYRIVVTGHAYRLGFPIPDPQLEKFGGLPVFYVGGYFEHGELISFPCGDSVVPIYKATWKKYYRTTKKPGPGFVPPNPFSGFEGATGKVDYKPPKPVAPLGD